MHYKQYLNKLVFEKTITLEMIEDLIAEKAIPLDSMKKEIISKIKTSNDQKLISGLFYQIYDEVFDKAVQHYIVDQNLTKVNGLADLIKNIIVKSSDDFETTKELVNSLGEGLIDYNKLLSGRKVKIDDALNPKYKNTLVDLLHATKELKRSGGDEGPGEIALEILSNNITKANIGDLIIDGQEIEIKSTQARMASSLFGYGSASKGLLDLGDLLRGLGFQIKGNFSFGMGYIKDLNDFLPTLESKDATKVNKAINKFFVDTFQEYGDKFWKAVYDSKKRQIDVNNWRIEFHSVMFDLYKKTDGFKGILFLNKKTLECIFIDDSKKLRKNAGLFKMDWGPTYDKQRTNGVSRIWLA